MTILVADTSALVSLGIVADQDADPLSYCLNTYDVVLPEIVVKELRETAEYDDIHGNSARSVLGRTGTMTTKSVRLDVEFPLDDGENAAVTLANEIDASLFLCDEFTRLGLIHASLATTQLVTTPTLLAMFVHSDHLEPSDALIFLEKISNARSWESNSYVQRARTILE